jgi:hypothetical protein
LFRVERYRRNLPVTADGNFLDLRLRAGKLGLAMRFQRRAALVSSHRVVQFRFAGFEVAHDVFQFAQPQASLGLLRQLRFAGNVREASGRASWRAFALA